MSLIKTTTDKHIYYNKETNKLFYKYIICLSELPSDIEEIISQMIYKFKFKFIIYKMNTYHHDFNFSHKKYFKYNDDCGVICKNGNKCRAPPSKELRGLHTYISCPKHMSTIVRYDRLETYTFTPCFCGKHNIFRHSETKDKYLDRMRDQYLQVKGYKYNKHGYIIKL